MPAFDHTDDLTDDTAFQLALNGPVTLYWRPEVLDETLTWFAGRGYQLVRLDAGGWTTKRDFHRAVKAALDFPDYYGDNLDAFSDCMDEVAQYVYGSDPDATGTVLVFTGYDVFAVHERRAAQDILDIIAKAAHLAALFGHRLQCLVQSNEPAIRFAPVGATAVSWNHKEIRRG